LVLVTTGGVASFFLLALAAVLRSRFAPVAMGKRTLIGRVGTVRQSLAPQGIVHLEGEMWSAVSTHSESIPVGAAVRVVGVDGLVLRVELVAGDAPHAEG
jgi:membrane-bound serine protease (ClpP class)